MSENANSCFLLLAKWILTVSYIVSSGDPYGELFLELAFKCSCLESKSFSLFNTELVILKLVCIQDSGFTL